MLSLVPYLMGFHVEDGVVVLVCSTGSVEVALRLDHWMFTDPMAVLNRVEGIIANVHDPKLFLVGYGPDRDLAEQSLALLETGFAPEDILDSIYTDGERWWSRTCAAPCCPPEGTPCDPATPAAASAVLAGSVALASRSELERQVEGPSLFDQAGMLAEVTSIHERVAPMSTRKRANRVRRLVSRGVEEQLDELELMELAVLVGTIDSRDTAWLMMSQEQASEHLALWQQVVANCLDADAVAPLCLMASAAWLRGNGALMGICLQRAETLDPDYSMLTLLAEIHQVGAPPSMWGRIIAA